MKKFIYVDSPKLPRREGKVTFPVSYDYNGGIIVNGKWFKGYKVGNPIIPSGYKLVTLGIGLQLNARPPLATMFLEKTGTKSTQLH